MKKLTIVTFLSVFFEIVSSVPIVTIQNNPSKPATTSNSYLSPSLQFTSLSTILGQRTNPGYGIGLLQFQPRNILANILSSPVQNLLGYLMSSVYALGNMFGYQPNPTVITTPAVKKPSIKRNTNTHVNKTPSKKVMKVIPSNTFITNNSMKPERTNFRGSLFFNSLGQLVSVGDPSTSQSPLDDVKIAPGIPTQKPRSTVTVKGENGKIYVNGEAKYSDDETFIKRHEVRVRIRGGNFYVNNNLVMSKGSSDHEQLIPSLHNLHYPGVTSFVLKIHSNGYLDYSDDNGGRLHTNYYTPIINMNL